MTGVSLPVSSRYLDLAVAAVSDEGLQVPPQHQFEVIMSNAINASFLLWASAIEQPTPHELDEMFCDFVVRCVNRGPGVGDVRDN